MQRRSHKRRIGRRLYIEGSTVKTHLSNIYKKLGVSGRTEAIKWGKANGFGQEEQSDQSGDSPLPFDKLEPRLLEVVGLVAQAKTNNEIATQLGISPLTVKSYLERIGQTLGQSDRREIAKAFNSLKTTKTPHS